jgi:hypothetical protein
MNRISAEQVAAYRRDGFAAVTGVLTASQIQEARGILDEFSHQASRLRHANSPFHFEPNTLVLQRVDNPVNVHPFFDAVMRLAAVLDNVASLIEPNVRYHHSKINMKLAGSGRAEGFA